MGYHRLTLGLKFGMFICLKETVWIRSITSAEARIISFAVGELTRTGAGQRTEQRLLSGLSWSLCSNISGFVFSSIAIAWINFQCTFWHLNGQRTNLQSKELPGKSWGDNQNPQNFSENNNLIELSRQQPWMSLYRKGKEPDSLSRYIRHRREGMHRVSGHHVERIFQILMGPPSPVSAQGQTFRVLQFWKTPIQTVSTPLQHCSLSESLIFSISLSFVIQKICMN